MTLEDVRNAAREKLKGICAVYPICDGASDRICQRENYGKSIGMGGIGLGGSFRANVGALARLKLNTSVLGENLVPDPTFDFFGRRLSMPVMGASTSGMSQYNDAISEPEFCRVALKGCLDAGTISWRGDTFMYDENDHWALNALADLGGAGVPIFKPRAQEALLKLIARAQALSCLSVGVDLDGHGSSNFARVGKVVYRKTPTELRELVQSTSLPFIAKGVMQVKDAEACVRAGVKAIVVSNHGGRVLDSTPGTAEVLPRIVDAVGKDVVVLADGGVRSGFDVLKMLALGAKAVLVGRDLIRAGIGGGAEGVSLQMETYRRALCHAMRMTGCADLASVERSILIQGS